MTSEFGKTIKVSIYGESHGPCVGVRVTGFPAGEPVDMEVLQRFLDRRAPGRSALTTPRKETDIPKVLSGIGNGKTTGEPIRLEFQNSDTHSSDYEMFRHIPRPGHADYTGRLRFGEEADLRGGGHFSGRLTAPLCAAGGIALQILERKGIRIGAHLKQVGPKEDRPFDPVSVSTEDFARVLGNELPVLDETAGEAMKQEILQAKAREDSVGGAVECAVLGLPGGLGTPMFDGVENVLAQVLFGIPAVKAVEFGAGTGFAFLHGSQANDAFCIEAGGVRTRTNNCGGILGGITDGMPLMFTVTFKPTPSIGRSQLSVDLEKMEETKLEIRGRHDPCVALRAVPVTEAAAALCVLDMLMDREAQRPVIPSGMKDPAAGLAFLREQIDRINREMVELFRQRMEVSSQIAACKKQSGKAIDDPAREERILEAVGRQAGPELDPYVRRLFAELFDLSKEYQKAVSREKAGDDPEQGEDR